MELLVIMLLFMICVIAVAIRKDVQDMSKRDLYARKKKSEPAAIIEAKKDKQQTMQQGEK